MWLTYIAYLSFAICLAGIIFRLARWFTVDVGPEEQVGRPGERLAGALRAVKAAVLHPRRLGNLLLTAVLDLLLQRAIFRRSRSRWLAHICLSYGIVLLVGLHVFADQITARFFPDYVATLDPFQGARHILGALVLLGIVLAYAGRWRGRVARRTFSWADRWILALLAAIVISGACLEAARIVSPALFKEMVHDYMGSDDPEAVAPLKAYWAAEFQVGFAPPPKMEDPAVLEAGRRLHEDYCAACHSPPGSALLAYPLTAILKPVAGVLDRLQADRWLEYAHYLISCLALMLLPFTKLFHLVSTPANLAVAAGGAPAAHRSVNQATRRVLGMAACSHCRVCSEHCAVAPIEQVLGIAWILPSEKVGAVSREASEKLDPEQQALLSEASFICTDCGRCTAWCPARIDLQDLWQASRSALIRKGYPQADGWIRRRTAAQWAQDLKARAEVPREAPGLDRPLIALSDKAETFWACVQCTTCTNVCPVVALSKDPQRDLDLTPQQVMNLMRLRLKEMALGSRMVWDCVSCYKCQEHCPQGVRVADVLYELRNEACRRLKNPLVRAKAPARKGGRP